MCAPIRDSAGRELPIKLVVDFDDETLVPGKRARLTLPDRRKINTSKVMECISHPTHRSCWVRTAHTVYTTDEWSVNAYRARIRNLWQDFCAESGCEPSGVITRDVTIGGMGSYSAGTPFDAIRRDFEQTYGIPVQELNSQSKGV